MPTEFRHTLHPLLEALTFKYFPWLARRARLLGEIRAVSISQPDVSSVRLLTTCSRDIGTATDDLHLPDTCGDAILDQPGEAARR